MKREYPIPVSTAATMAGMDRRRMYDAINAGEITAVQEFGQTSQLGIYPSELKRYMKQASKNGKPAKKNGK